MTQATNFGGLPWNVEECLSSWCEITVIHQDKVGFKQETGWSRCKGMFFYQTSCSWFKGKFCWSSPWGKSFRNTSLEQCSKPRVVPLKNCLGNSDYHNDDSSRSIQIYIYIHISIIWVNIISVIIKPTGILNTAHLGISIVFF